MITACDSIDFCADDYCLTKIKCLLRAYGVNMPFLQFYKWQEGEQYGIICKFYTSVTVWLNCEISEEVLHFVNLLGYSEILSNVKIGTAEFGTLIKSFNSTAKEISRNYTVADYKKLYTVFANAESDSVSLGDFDAFYVDISHRVRHNSADVFVSDTAGGILLFDGKNAILNGIAVAKQAQGQGESRAVLEYFYNTANAENMLVMCKKELEGYYIKNGFEFLKDVYYIKGEL